jgi:hypothetical protein
LVPVAAVAQVNRRRREREHHSERLAAVAPAREVGAADDLTGDLVEAPAGGPGLGAQQLEGGLLGPSPNCSCRASSMRPGSSEATV